MKSRLLEINRMINRFQVDFEGKKVSVMESQEFKDRWADILEAQSQQPNGRRIFMQIYPHPIMGLVRIAKWLPKKNICEQDHVFLTQTADDLRYDEGTFVVENGPFEGHYRKITDTDCISVKTTKMEIRNSNDSGFCANCSVPQEPEQYDPEFVEIEFSGSDDSEYERLAQKAREKHATSTKIEKEAEASTSQNVTTSDADELERRE